MVLHPVEELKASFSSHGQQLHFAARETKDPARGHRLANGGARSRSHQSLQLAGGLASREGLGLRLQLVEATSLPFLTLKHLVSSCLPYPSFITGSHSQEWVLPVSWMINTVHEDLVNMALHARSSHPALPASRPQQIQMKHPCARACLGQAGERSVYRSLKSSCPHSR